jgi:hypothetical protein
MPPCSAIEKHSMPERRIIAPCRVEQQAGTLRR